MCSPLDGMPSSTSPGRTRPHPGPPSAGTLLRLGKLGSFDFNSRFYADDDLIVGAATAHGGGVDQRDLADPLAEHWAKLRQYDGQPIPEEMVKGERFAFIKGTPRLLAWCEAATCAAIAETLEPSRTSVGTRVSLEHLAASPVGERVEVQASVAYVDGRLVRFSVAASHVSDGKVVGTGEVTRVVVDRERFLSRVSGPPAG